jgi:hypothetical protein
VGRRIYKKLKQKEIDVDFLVWLEGREDRLPRIEKIFNVSPADFAISIVAAVWLAQFFAYPETIAPSIPNDWLRRYQTLQGFLITALRHSLPTRRNQQTTDLTVLQTTLKRLLPDTVCAQYFRDIQSLHKKGEPKSFKDAIRRRRGGKQESEQTNRMRAAIEYLKSTSDQEWLDLAELWNEQRAGEYHPDELRARLRKGSSDEREKGAVALEFWQDIYNGDFRAIVGGPFPLSPELEEVANRTRILRDRE